MANKFQFPPLWVIKLMFTAVPRMLWAQRRGDYLGVMEIVRKMSTPKIKKAYFKGYEPTSHDVFVCTYAKSGTYWMLQIVTQIAGHGRTEFDHIHDIAPWPESPLPGVARLKAPTWKESPTKMRAIKTHAEAQFVPYNADAKYVVIIRDPKDVIISAFHFADSLVPGLSSIGLDAWTEAFKAEKAPWGIWAEHVACFWEWRNRKNVQVLMFDEIKRDLDKAVRAVAKLMQVDLSETEIAEVVRKSEFTYMKSVEDKFTPPSPLATKEPIEIIRKGKTGEATEMLTAEQLKSVDEAMKAQLKAFGSDFPYDEYF
jgi:hypothetical protein